MPFTYMYVTSLLKVTRYPKIKFAKHSNSAVSIVKHVWLKIHTNSLDVYIIID